MEPAKNSRKGAELVQPIMLEGLSWIVGGLGGKALGKAVGWGLSHIFNNVATKGFKSFALLKSHMGLLGKVWHGIISWNRTYS